MEEWITELQAIMENGCEPMHLIAIVGKAVEEYRRTKATKEIEQLINSAGRRSQRRATALKEAEMAEKKEFLMRVSSAGRLDKKERKKAEEMYIGQERAAQSYHWETEPSAMR